MNKPRLIDANALLEAMEKIYRKLEKNEEFHTSDEFYGIARAFTAIELLIKERPTAYDIDKVVEQLEELETYKQTVTMEKHPFCASEIETVSKKKAFEIVKGGAE